MTPVTEGSPLGGPLPPRLWRPLAQRHVRNAFSTIASARSAWDAASGRGLATATALVNAGLSARYVDDMDLGVLSDLEDLRPRAKAKLQVQMVTHAQDLLAAYHDLVAAVDSLSAAAQSMQTVLSPATLSSPAATSAAPPENLGATGPPAVRDFEFGDGGGVAVFFSLPFEAFEAWAREVAAMLAAELHVKWQIMKALTELSPKRSRQLIGGTASWRIGWEESDGSCEEDELSSTESSKADGNGQVSMTHSLPPGRSQESSAEKDEKVAESRQQPPGRDSLQVLLTVWLAEINIDKRRLGEILSSAADEMKGLSVTH